MNLVTCIVMAIAVYAVSTSAVIVTARSFGDAFKKITAINAAFAIAAIIIY